MVFCFKICFEKTVRNTKQLFTEFIERLTFHYHLTFFLRMAMRPGYYRFLFWTKSPFVCKKCDHAYLSVPADVPFLWEQQISAQLSKCNLFHF